MKNIKTGISNKVTAASLLVALGIIYGDIGTSPLYGFYYLKLRIAALI
jgi:KUP system potassium uptake protein